MRAQMVQTIEKVINFDDRTVLLLGDIGVYGFRNALKNFPMRTYNIGVLEQSTVSVAAGLSLNGLIPIVHTIATFLVERSFEQIKVDLCYQELGANLISVGGSYDYSSLGCTHHCPGDVMMLNETPNTEIIVPGHKNEFDRIFNQIYDSNKTSYFRLSEISNNNSYDIKFANNLILQEGSELVIIAVGPMLQKVLNATKDLDVTIVYCTTVKPFDYESISHLLNKKTLICEPYYSGPILKNINIQSSKIKGNYKMIGVPNKFINKYGTISEIDKHLNLDELSIRNKIIEMIND